MTSDSPSVTDSVTNSTTVHPADVEQEQHYEHALATLTKALTQYDRCSDEEKKALLQDFRSLQEMKRKLESGRVEIVLFGEIDTGKSALINALVGEAVAQVDVRGGWTKEVWKVPWAAEGCCVPGLDSSQIVLLDTPGINEVDGEQRAAMARDAAERADVILFVTDSDLNSLEYNALVDLAAGSKPVIVVVNKMDIYRREDRDRLLKVLREDRLGHLISHEDVVPTTADPLEKEYIIEATDGTTRTEFRKPGPDVEQLKVRILEVLERDGKALLALNAAMYAADRSDRIAAVKIRLRDERASRVIMSYAVTKAVSVALIPPVVDVATGGIIDATMVVTLGKVYGIDMNWTHARGLVKSIFKSAGWALLPDIMTQVGSVIFKGLTLHAAAPITALPQGAAAGYGSYIVGQASKYYFEHGASWGGEAPKTVVTRILKSIDKESVLSKLKDEIAKKINLNRHAGR